MSAFVLTDKETNALACTFNHYAEFGGHGLERTKPQIQKLISDLKIEKAGSNNFHGVTFLNAMQSNSSAEKIAKALYALNVGAVNCRYNETDTTEYTGFKNVLPCNSKHQTYKTLRCLLYQCSEGDTPEKPLFKQLESISDALAHDIVSSSKEFDQAAWG